MVGATLAVALEVGLHVTRMGKGDPCGRPCKPHDVTVMVAIM